MKNSEVEYVNQIKNAKPFNWKDKLGYFLGDFGFNSLQVLVNTYLMLFAVNIVGIKAVHFVAIIFICKALDAINDTFIGRIIDLRPGTRNGKFKPYILWFAVPYIISTALLFLNMQSAPYWLKITFCLGMYFIWGILGTFINVPYGAMVNSMTTNQMQRTELSNARSIGSLGANVIATTIAPLIIFDAMDNPIASRFIPLALILSVVTFISLYFTHKLCNERIVLSVSNANAEKVPYWQILKTFMKNRPMIAVILAYIISKFFIQTISLTNQYVFMTHYHATEKLAAVGLTSILPMIFAMVLLKPLSKIFGKKNLITWPLLISAVLYSVLAIYPVSATAWIVIQLIASFFTAFFSLLIWSLIADAVDYQAYLTGERNDGTVYATITFIVFFVASLSTSIIAMLLDMVGYDATLGSTQLMGTSENIKMLSGVLPVVGCILIFVCFSLIYNITDEKMKEISAAVNRQSEELEKEFEEGQKLG